MMENSHGAYSISETARPLPRILVPIPEQLNEWMCPEPDTIETVIQTI
jgi:hypothetical protein